MTDWIHAPAVSFARRLVQEAEIMEKQWNELQSVPSYCERFVEREAWEEEAERFAQPRPLIVLMEDELIHTDEHPFCDDPSYGCHQDIDLLKEQIFEPFFNGLLTAPEAHRFMEGKQL